MSEETGLPLNPWRIQKMSSGGGAGPTLGLGMVNVLPYVNCVSELKGFVEFKRIGKLK